jgi:hypothetical protein
MRTDYTIGLDLGQTTDYSALAVVESASAVDDGVELAEYTVRHLQRFPLGTAYTAIVPAVARLAASGPLHGAPLVVDQTGVGRPVVDMLRRAPLAGQLVPVTITAGHSSALTEDRSFHVPKKEVVTCLQLLLQGRRLKVAQALPHADVLATELQNFRVRITAAAHEVFGAWRGGDHDDLVLAVALACWWAERHPPSYPKDLTVGQGVSADELERAFPNG